MADRVVVGPQHLIASENDYDWLGHFVYFWENSPSRATHWAAEKAERARKVGVAFDPVVIGAVIDLGNCLDLFDASSVELVEAAHAYLKTVREKESAPLPANESLPGGSGNLLRRLDCAVLNALHALMAQQGGPAFDSVRSAFVEGDPIYPHAGFRRKNHIQICVRRSDNIRGYFYPFP